MSDPALDPSLQRALSGARRRVAAIVPMLTLPPLIGLLLALARLVGAPIVGAVAVGGALLIAVLLWRGLRGYDRAWLARRLNTLRPDFDDSIELLWSQAADSSPLQPLQRQRLRTRLAAAELPDLRPPLPWRALALSAALGLLFAASTLLPPWQAPTLPRSGASESASESQLIDARLRVEPPAYTGVKASMERSLEVRVPENSRVEWSLGFAQAPSAVALVFDDGTRLALAESKGRWIGARQITASTLYRIDATGIAANDPLYRLDAIADRMPEISVRAPDKTLSLIDAAQPQWQLSFEARDDYGLGAAELSIAVAQGSGESIEVQRQTQTLQGEGGARERRYRQTLDLKQLGFAQGDDLIVRLSVRDNREPQPNVARSASFILRWPPEMSADSAGLDGMVRQAMPAYFSSQRQIVIDTEALIAERAQLSAAAFEQRADQIGVDQKLLRLRYGQFLGEESEGEGGDQAHDEHAAGPGAPKPGSDDAVLHEYGHVHDIKEAATLLDDATKTLLRSALGEMWSAEGQLRSMQPEAALPHEYRALEAIKQVQQSTRIYLARVGQELPEVDPTRRLSGERAGLVDPPSPAARAMAPTTAPAAAWQALQRGEAPDVAALQAWARDPANAAPDALALMQAAERLRRDPACGDCRAALGAQLWPLLPPPGTALQPRALPDAQSARYLQALAPEPAR